MIFFRTSQNHVHPRIIFGVKFLSQSSVVYSVSFGHDPVSSEDGFCGRRADRHKRSASPFILPVVSLEAMG
jgi:hypothetical protein